MIYETSNKEATNLVKGGISTHAIWQQPELEYGALDHSAILNLYEEQQYLFFMFFISHIDVLYSIAHFECNLNIFYISYAPWCKMFP